MEQELAGDVVVCGALSDPRSIHHAGIRAELLKRARPELRNESGEKHQAAQSTALRK
jgi:hypothetical protein